MAPDESLFLRKPTAQVPHGGGQVLLPDSRRYDLLRGWVEGGVVFAAPPAELVSLRVLPESPSIPLPEMQQQIAVLATYSDGSQRDVTAEAFVESGDIEVTAVDDQGLVTALRRGESPILVRYEGHYAATRLVVMGDREGWEWEPVAPHNWIDTLVFEKLQRVKSQPSDLCTDAEFLRRVSLDLSGLPPSPREVRTFLLDARDSPTKRNELIDRLIGGPDFVDYWTNKWADLLQVNSKWLGAEGAERFRAWIQGAVASNRPYDRFVNDILRASGPTYDNPPASYFKILRKPDVVMENTTQLFLGVRFNCNKCHDHPFERWTQRDHWRMAGFFAQVGRVNVVGSPLMPGGGGNQPGEPPVAQEEIIYDAATGEVIDPRTGEIAIPTFPFEHAGTVEGTSRRARLASWLTARENPYFAKSYVNRLWSYFLGVGLIDPVDDIRAGNPPSNPELLERLTEDFLESDFDVRHLMRLICRSRTYQLSVSTNRWNEFDRINYSHAQARRLPAEVLYDALHLATGSRSRLPGVRPGTRAIELVDSSVEAPDGFLGLFGRPPRESVCECERTGGMSLGQALNLVNGPTLADALRDPDNAIAELVQYESDPGRIVDELYVRFLCRLPGAEERAEMARILDPRDPANAVALSPEDLAELERRLAAWEEGLPKVAWKVAEVLQARSQGGATLTSQEDGSILVSGTAPDKDIYTVVLWTDLPRITGLRIEALPDESLPARGPGRSENGNIVLSELRVTVVPASDPSASRPLSLENATADFAQEGYPVAAAVDGKPETGWALLPRLGEGHEAVFEVAEDAGAEGGSTLVLTIEHNYGALHALGRFRISVTSSDRPVRYHGLPAGVAQALEVEPGSRTPEQHATVHAHYVSTDPEMSARIRLGAAQDLAWALANSPGFLFNR